MAGSTPTPPPQEPQKPHDPVVQHVLLGTIFVYQISDAELDEMEHGAPAHLWETLCLTSAGVALPSIASCFLIDSGKQLIGFVVFVVMSIVASACAMIFGKLWHREKKQHKAVCKRVRNRRPGQKQES